MTWLAEILDGTSELEAPSNFYYWSGLTAISAVLKDNVWINMHAFNLYPNIYVMLHADSGLRKGPAVALAKELVQKTGVTRIISGRSSIQGILKELGTTHSVKGGKLAYGGKAIAYIVSSELTSSLVEDKAAATILTDLYDRHYNSGNWKSLLKMETFDLKNPTISMLTATNEAHSSDFFEKRDIMGGYFARTFIIHETKRNTINSLMMKPTRLIDKEKLSGYLTELSKLSGPFKGFQNEDGSLTDAGKYYNDWYTDFQNTVDIQEIKDDTGTLNRFGDSVLKVAMLLSLSESPEMEITAAHMEESVSRCEQLIGNIRKATYGKKGESTVLIQQSMVIKELLERPNHAITRVQLLKKYWMQASAEEWDKIMQSFNDSGMIEIQSIGNQIVYVMPEKQVKELLDHMKGKMQK